MITPDFKKRAIEILISALISAAMVIAAGYGYTVNVLEPLIAEGQVTARGGGTTHFNSAVYLDSGATVTNGLTADSATVSGALTSASLTASGAVSAGSLQVGGLTQSGAVRFGTGTVISGTTIAHGFATTPTVFLVQNALIQAATFTQTLYAYGCNTVSCTVGLTQGSITTTTAFWLGGK